MGTSCGTDTPCGPKQPPQDTTPMINRDRTFSASSIAHESPAVNTKQFEAVTEELILLSTRNANLEQQLDEMKKKYDALQVCAAVHCGSEFEILRFDVVCGAHYGSQYGQDSILHSMKNSQSDAQQIQAPIGFICDELNINRKTLSQHIVMDQLEQLYLTINGQLTFTETQVRCRYQQM